MPFLGNSPENFDWIDPDEVCRPVVVYGAAMANVRGLELNLHSHRKGQVLFVQRGALSCELQSGLWIVPPRSAI